jgi:enamine deaminase RidA (YjgF/YER057c/UK114 family)/dienelactone hydrolase
MLDKIIRLGMMVLVALLATPAEARESESVRAAAEQVMGPLPSREGLPPLAVETLDETVLDGGLIRRKVRYATETDDRVSAWLFLPPEAAQGRRPAVLCLHQTTAIGKDEPAGLGGLPNLHYALELARRGFVTLAPDYPSFGEHAYDFSSRTWQSGSLKAVWDNMRGVDLLANLPQVDPDRIGCIGHSLGGHNAIFTAAFDDRLKAIVSSCGFTPFRHYKKGDLTGWTSPRYMPRIASEFGHDPARMPFDFPELIAAMAPRGLFVNAPLHDDNFDCAGVKEAIASAKPAYEAKGAAGRLAAVYPDCGHDFPEAARAAAYAFLAAQLAPEHAPRKPLTIGMIGLDTSHCLAFTEMLNVEANPQRIPGGRVALVYPKGSPDIASSVSRVPDYTKKITAMGVEVIDDLEAMIAQVDAVLLETNDGRPHLEQALPVLRARKPLFIDKPVAGSLADTIAIYRLADHFGTQCFSASSLRFAAGTQKVRNGSLGVVTGCDTFSPCALEPTHPDLFWYGIHGCEALFTVMGIGCREVTRLPMRDGEFVVGVWDGDRIGTFRGSRGGKPGYGGTAFGAAGTAAVGASDGYRPLLVEIMKFFETGAPPVTPAETIELFAFMEAADESKRRGHVAVKVADVVAKAEVEAAAKVRAILAAEKPKAALRFHRPDANAHFSDGVAAPAAPLLWTSQFAATLPMDPGGDVEPAVAAVVASLTATLQRAGCSLADLVRLQVAVDDDAQTPAVLAALERHLPDAHPAVSIVTAAPGADAGLLIDAVAVAAPSRATDQVHIVPGPEGTAAVIPTGAKVFLSGLAASGEPRAAVAGTIGQLAASLDGLGLGWGHVGQIRVFHQASLARSEVIDLVRQAVGVEPCPPVVAAVWTGGLPVEIEVVAHDPTSRDSADGDETIFFITPAGVTPSAGYTRIVRISAGPTIWTGGMVASGDAADGDSEAGDVFDRVVRTVEALGGDRRHLVKATYFVTSDEAAASLRRVRATVYERERPPAASLVAVRGVGHAHRGQSIDMIAVPAQP